jgi:class 3 adenylate cyclase/tetratricopeptide (TPR) repeat protein
MCPSCGAAVRPGDRFCASCGAPVAGTPTPPQAVSGARKLVTLLFADTVGSTSLITDVDPEVAVARLQPVIDAMTDAVHAFGGTVSAVMGDGVLALFGAPVAHENHAVRAAYAAVQMLDDVRRATGGTVDIRVGIHTGEVLVRTVVTDLSRDYTALGPPVHLASRMERMAQPGQALLTAQTRRMAEGFVDTEPLGLMAVRGLDEPVDVHRLLGRSRAVGTWIPRGRRQLTRFVGRDRELATLRLGLDAATRGVGRLSVVVGEAGVGKSRLIHEYIAAVSADATVRRLYASPYDTSTPYHPLIPLVGGTDRDVTAPAGGSLRDRVRAGAAEITPSADEIDIDPLVAMVGGHPDSDEWATLDPFSRRRRIRDAVTTLIAGAAARGPQVIVLEDLHWIDEDTRAVLDDIADVVPGHAIHLVVTFRPEYGDLWADRVHDRIHLHPLQGVAAAELIDALLGADPSVARLRDALLAHTGGTPLFVEETVMALAETRSLLGDHGAYRHVGAVDDLTLPDTVQSVIAARVDRLSPDDKHVLQVASVIGETVPLEVLAVTGNAAADALTSTVDRLRTAAFVYDIESRHELAFKHNLIREVVYGEMPHGQRRQLHGAVADVLAADSETAEASVERLAHHTFNAERWEAATEYLWRAAVRSEARSAYPQARRFLTMGLDAAAHLDDTPRCVERRVDMACALRVAATGSGLRLRAVLTDLDRAVTLADGLGDRMRRAMVEIHRSYVGSLTGDHSLAVSAAQTVQQLGAALDDRYLVVEGRLAEGQALAMACHPAAVPPLLEPDAGYLRTTVGADRRGMTTTRVLTSLSWIAIAYALMGDVDHARQILVERTAIAEAGGRPFDLVFGCWTSGTVELHDSRPDAALRFYEQGLEIAALHDLEFVGAWIRAHAGRVQADLGDPNAALRTLDLAEAAARPMENALIIGWADAHRARAHVALGDRPAARHHARRALAFAREHDHPLLQATSLRWLASATDDPGAADGLLGEAIEVCRDTGLVPARRELEDARDALTRA